MREKKSIFEGFFTFLVVYLDRTWHGLRFLRSLIILNLADVLVYIRIVDTSSAIRLTKLVSIFVTVVSFYQNFFEAIYTTLNFTQIVASAGVVHLLENSGDPWRNFENSHDPYLSYGDCIYFMFVTMSTVSLRSRYSRLSSFWPLIFRFAGWIWRHLLWDFLGQNIHRHVHAGSIGSLCEFSPGNRTNLGKQTKVRVCLVLGRTALYRPSRLKRSLSLKGSHLP